MAELSAHYIRDEVVGKEAWLKIVARWGGQDWLVPPNTKTDRGSELARIIGDRLAEQLTKYAGGTRIYVHSDKKMILSARLKEMREMRARGMTIMEISNVIWPMRYSERHVMRLLATDTDERQG